VALVATELATNLVKHIEGGGVLLAQPIESPGAVGVEMLALDRGPGMFDVARCLQDGYSTRGTPGTGLGAVSRLSDLFDVYSLPGAGTAILSHVQAARGEGPSYAFEIGALSIPKPGQEVCGDAWSVQGEGDRISLLVVDGLGHGPGAAVASQEAVRVFRSHPGLSPAEAVERIHGALRSTRGAAVAVAEINRTEHRVRFAGVGNIAGNILANGRSQGLLSHNGTAGAAVRKVQEFPYAWPRSAVLVLHSDGLASRWDLDRHTGLLARHPSLIAGVLYRDFSRGRDDVTVAVVGDSGSPDQASAELPPGGRG
jgi:hypothetical protein